MYPQEEPTEREKESAKEIMHRVNDMTLNEVGLVAAMARARMGLNGPRSMKDTQTVSPVNTSRARRMVR